MPRKVNPTTGELTENRSKALVEVDPAPILERLELMSENIGTQLEAKLFPRIRFPSGGGSSFAVPTSAGTDDIRDLDLLILAVQPNRSFWNHRIGDGSPSPDCFSNDGKTGQGDPGGECAACPYDEWGSIAAIDPSQTGRAKACRESLAVLALRLPEGVPMIVRIPPASRNIYQHYGLLLASEGHNISGVVTRLSLRPVVSRGGITYAQAEFHRVGSLGGDVTQNVANIRKVLSGGPQVQFMDAGEITQDEVAGQ